MTNEKAMEILYDLQPKYFEDGNDSEIIDAIDVALEAMGGYLPQNHYYRTADRMPTADDAEPNGSVFVSQGKNEWFIRNYKSPEIIMWKFWAPVPKVEVRG